ncbi:Acetyl esterase/lipase [Roseovarius pacificus]|uniref:Acetyl esterase/lipase n=1 Tax=Roseovarius pacificus TaxID=337701 RepID=A0A1M7BI75_9RHOB|nr:alpha/beta hydrolase [Roseovarius pacificus]GGO55099.1 esterase [Roseovarius pacificus]SHL54319.1 Acetyl esterase/lipase [Roseovarius pacificus]
MELDDAYANAAHIPGAEGYPPRWTQQAAAFRETLSTVGRASLAIPYGDSPCQKLDLFLPEGVPNGVCVFVHGGYWLRFDNSYWSHLAAGPLARGWAVAMPSYDLCPDVTIAGITLQIARAVTVVAEQVAGPVALSGHSAGGHLVARMAVPGVLPPEVAPRLRSIVPISPMADLRPMLKTSMNAQFGLDLTAAEAESPVLMRPMDVPVTVWVGADERPAFLDQARWLAEAWGCGHVVAEGRHHFDVVDALASPDSAMVAALVD